MANLSSLYQREGESIEGCIAHFKRVKNHYYLVVYEKEFVKLAMSDLNYI